MRVDVWGVEGDAANVGGEDWRQSDVGKTIGGLEALGEVRKGYLGQSLLVYIIVPFCLGYASEVQCAVQAVQAKATMY